MIKYFVLMIYLCGCCSFPWPGATNAQRADFFLDISKYMSKPYMWVRSNFSRLYTPFSLGNYGQYNSIYTEILYRNILLNSLLSIGPTAVIIGELAALPRLLSYKLRDQPYHVLNGTISNKILKNGKFTLFNMNICFLPGELPLFFGGVAPASERVNGIASLILDQNADLVCLYEVHEIDSAYALYKKLKKNYAYFYVDIGPSILEMNSGLFVASKYEIINPQFKPFHYLGMQTQINKGYFSFQIIDKDSIIAQIYTTHLQPYRENVDEKIRKAELNEIIENINLNYSNSNSFPTILCGDLNIPWGSEEYEKSGLKQYFTDNYNHPNTLNEPVDPKNRTYSACLTGERWKKENDPLISCSEIIDYLLIFGRNKRYDVQTKVIKVVNDLDSKNALSDHNGLFSVIKIKAIR